MANFNYYNSTARHRFLEVKTFGLFYTILIFVFLLFIFAGGYLLFFGGLSDPGIGKIIIGLSGLLCGYFLAKKYYQAVKKESSNLADNFSFETIDFLEKAIRQAAIDGFDELTPEYLFSKIYLSKIGQIMSVRLILPYKEDEKGPRKTRPVFGDNLVNLFSQIKGKIEVEDFISLAADSPTIHEYLTSQQITPEEVKILAGWIKSLRKYDQKIYFWQDETILAGVGQDWSYGYTPILSAYSRDLSLAFQSRKDSINVYGHTNKINEIEAVLGKSSKNNVLLVGEPGTGKKSIVDALAAKVAIGDCLPSLKYKRIRQLDVGRLLAGAAKEEVVARLEGALSDAVRAGNIIIFIDNFQSLVGGSLQGFEEAGAIDASQVLIPYLENSELRIIGAVTPDDYFSRVRQNFALAGSFEKIDVNPAGKNDTLAIMLESVLYLEFKNKVFFPVQTLKEIIELSDRYIHDLPFPEKALRLMDEAAVTYANSEQRVIFPEQVDKLITIKTNVPVGEAASDEKEKLLNLENFLHERVIGQDEAITAISDALRRVRAGLTTGKRPIGVFLFLGPTGVGKTETAKALAESYFGSEKNMIRIDMSEYQQEDSIGRLIGNEENPSGVLTDAVLQNPFSLILLDELEKANRDILNLFLQVFEDGRLTNARGKTSDFTNTIIIATSNAGSEFIRENISMEVENLKKQLTNKLQEEGIFAPEFLNRFDSIVVYKPLTEEQLVQVARLMIESLNKGLENKNMSIEVADDVLLELAKQGYDPEFGARPMRRVIQVKIENLLAKQLLSGTVGEGQVVNITMDDISS